MNQPGLLLAEADCIQMTKNWIESIVIGLNFCPFAKPAFHSAQIRYIALSSMDSAVFDKELMDALNCLDMNAAIETLLIIFPTSAFDFFDYLNLVEAWDGKIDTLGYRGVYQLASFHPKYQFAGAPIDDPANFTNRSPLPMVHILRESSIENALRKYPRPELIPEANIARARAFGLEQMKAYLSDCYIPKKGI
jgi:hypothetical protein